MFTSTDLPPALEPVLADVRSWANDAQRFGQAGPQGRAAWLSGLRQLADATEAAFTHALAELDTHGDGEVLHGAASTQAWLRGALRLAPGDAAERVRIARGTRSGLLAEPLRALAGGEVTYDQVRAIDRAVHPLPEAAKKGAVTVLTDLARRADTVAVRVAGRRLRHVVDPDGALKQVEADFSRRFLHLSPLLDGMTAVDGLLDAEAATTVATALAPFLVPAGPDDRRSGAQRRADGLVELAHAAIASGGLPVLSGAPATLQVVVPLDSLLGAPAAPPACLPDSPAGTGWLTPTTTARLACDATVARVLLDPAGVPLDLGRSVRLFTSHQRRGLAVRDGGCRFPRCARPARYTDAHHLVPWQHGGPTDLPNALLLCRFHHRLVHEGGWTISPDHRDQGANGPLTFGGPQAQRMTSHPRGP